MVLFTRPSLGLASKSALGTQVPGYLDAEGGDEGKTTEKKIANIEVMRCPKVERSSMIGKCGNPRAQ